MVQRMAGAANESQYTTWGKIVSDKPDLSWDVHSGIFFLLISHLPAPHTAEPGQMCAYVGHVGVGRGQVLACLCVDLFLVHQHMFPWPQLCAGNRSPTALPQQSSGGLNGWLNAYTCLYVWPYEQLLAVKVQQSNVHTYKIHSHLKYNNLAYFVLFGLDT